MAVRPTLHLTNWPSRSLHGPGRRLTIMVAPRRWERGDGRVPALLPRLRDLRAVQAGEIAMAEYKARFLGGLIPGAAFEALDPFADHAADLRPGALYTTAGGGTPVADGDTLLCGCSREAAARGECHRVWAAEALASAGWAVVLDGAEVAP